MKTILISLLLTASAFAQDAKIMIVEKSDSKKLAASYREYKEALKHWEETKAEVAKQYTTESGKVIAGWEKIQFSADFRAIVPESSQYASARYPSCNWTYATNTSGLTGGSGLVFSSTTPDLAYSSDSGVNQSLSVKEKP